MNIPIHALLNAKAVIIKIGDLSGLDKSFLTWTSRNLNALDDALKDYTRAEAMAKKNYDEAYRKEESEEARASHANALNWTLVTLQSESVEFTPASYRNLSWLVESSDKLELTGNLVAHLIRAGVIIDDMVA